MNADLLSVQFGVLILIAGVLVLSSRGDARRRLESLTRKKALNAEAEGSAVLIASLAALVRNGSGLVEAYEELSDRRFATEEVTYDRVHTMLREWCLPAEQDEGMEAIAVALVASYRLSADSGCRPSDCLRVVADMQKRQAAMKDARDGAFAMPRATVKLLSGLPILTVFLGELMGAHPLFFLFRPGAGLGCLVVGTCFYCAGLIWMRGLLDGLEKGESL